MGSKQCPIDWNKDHPFILRTPEKVLEICDKNKCSFFLWDHYNLVPKNCILILAGIIIERKEKLEES